MYTAEHVAYTGKILTFKNSDPPYGNICRLYQGVRLTICTGSFSGVFSQRMIRGTSGVLENLAPEMLLSDQGKVEMTYPSETVTLTLEAGQIVEIAPGCAYALLPLTDASLIEVILSEKYPIKASIDAFRDTANFTLEDKIDFNLIAHTSKNRETPLAIKKENPAPQEENTSKSLLNLDILDKMHPRQQDIFPSTTDSIFFLGRMTALFFFSIALMSGTDSALFDFVLFIVASISMYLIVSEIKKLGKFLPLLSIIEDGLVISNRIYKQMPILWADIDALFLDSKTVFPNSSQLCIRIRTKKPIYNLDYMEPFSKQIVLSQNRILKEPIVPDILICQSETTEDIEWVYKELEKNLNTYKKATGH